MNSARKMVLRIVRKVNWSGEAALKRGAYTCLGPPTGVVGTSTVAVANLISRVPP